MPRAAPRKKPSAAKPEASDPVRDALDAAPQDDEPLTVADKRAITQARRGPYLTTDELRRKLGL